MLDLFKILTRSCDDDINNRRYLDCMNFDDRRYDALNKLHKL